MSIGVDLQCVIIMTFAKCVFILVVNLKCLGGLCSYYLIQSTMGLLEQAYLEPDLGSSTMKLLCEKLYMVRLYVVVNVIRRI